MKNSIKLMVGDSLTCLKRLDSKSIQCCVTSPPYFNLRDYDNVNQIGLEESPELYIEKLLLVFNEVYRILKNDGTLWLNISDSYVNNKVGNTNGSSGSVKQKIEINRMAFKKQVAKGYKVKDLIGIPWMLAFALRNAGWYLRSDIIWCKTNGMPESVLDRPTRSYEHIFLLSKSPQYFYNAKAVKESAFTTGFRNRAAEAYGKKTNTFSEGVGKDGKRNLRDFWPINSSPSGTSHVATFPQEIPNKAILAGSRPGDFILDPFSGVGTTGLVAGVLHRNYVGIELNEDYVNIAYKRINRSGGLFFKAELIK